MPPELRPVNSMRPNHESGWLYFIQDGPDGPVKIGRATDVRRRMRSLRSGNPRPLKLLAAVEGGAELETHVHRRLARARLGKSEWFRTAPVMAFLRRYGVTENLREGDDFEATYEAFARAELR